MGKKGLCNGPLSQSSHWLYGPFKGYLVREPRAIVRVMQSIRWRIPLKASSLSWCINTQFPDKVPVFCTISKGRGGGAINQPLTWIGVFSTLLKVSCNCSVATDVQHTRFFLYRNLWSELKLEFLNFFAKWDWRFLIPFLVIEYVWIVIIQQTCFVF